MPSWNSAALRAAREALGLTQEDVAIRMKTTIDTVRRVEGSYVREGTVRHARAKTVLAYCACLDLDEMTFRNRSVRLLTPTYVDFRPNDPYEDDPRAQGWRHSPLRFGIGHLEIEVEKGTRIRVLEVKLQTDLFDHIAMPPNGPPLSREEKYSKVLSLQHWCQWQAGETLDEGVEAAEDWGALGIVSINGMPAESQFDVPKSGLQQEAMFSLPPTFVTWFRFVSLWAEHPRDIRCNLTVRYRDGLGQVDMLRAPFVVSGLEVQELCVLGLKLQRGFPAFLEPYVS